MRRDDGRRRAQQRREHVGGIEAALGGRAQDGGENLLGVGSTPKPIAAPTHLASDHGRPDRLLGSPVRGVEIGSTRTLKRAVSSIVRCRAKRGISKQTRIVEQVQHLVEQVAASDIDAVRRDRARAVPVADIERVLDDARHAPRKAGAGTILLQRPAQPEEMAHAGLTECAGELPIWRPLFWTRRP